MPPSRSEMEIELSKLSSPRIFLVRMLVFLVLCGLVGVVLYKQIVTAFFANPGLNALIGAVLLIGVILAFRQVIRLYPEVAWVNNFRIADPGLAIERRPTLLAPMAAILGGERSGRMSISQQTMRHLLDSIATRLDEARDISRYMTGLLVFLGLLGTFWGLIETVGSVGKVIDGLKVGGDAGALFDTLKEGLAAPLGGMGISFSSSLFGLAGSLILGFLDLQSSQAQNRFYTDLEDWLATTVRGISGEGAAAGGADLQGAIDRLRATFEEGGGRGTTAAMANLAEAIQGLVAHMRTEQQMIREWADGQGEQKPRDQAAARTPRPPAGEELGGRGSGHRAAPSAALPSRGSQILMSSGSAPQSCALQRVRDTTVEENS
ncbi:hypothetical protein ACVILL_003629 [Bradyrhizobium sp. USDA 3364]